MHILNVRKKVLGVIISLEVATQRPPIWFYQLTVFWWIVFCFAHHWKGMAPSYKEMFLQLWNRAFGLLLGQLKYGVLP